MSTSTVSSAQRAVTANTQIVDGVGLAMVDYVNQALPLDLQSRQAHVVSVVCVTIASVHTSSHLTTNIALHAAGDDDGVVWTWQSKFCPRAINCSDLAFCTSCLEDGSSCGWCDDGDTKASCMTGTADGSSSGSCV